MKKIFSVLFLASVLVLCSCSSKGRQERRCITVSILPQRYFLEKIVGDNFDVKCMLAKGGNPETYEPSMSYMMVLEKSEAYFLMGNLGLELSIKGKIKDFNPDIRLFDMSEGIDVIHGAHHFSADDDHGADPHTWTSVANARVIVRNMFDAVCQLDPGRKAEYEKNYRAFDKELADFQEALSVQLAPVAGTAFAVWHPSLSYFARDFGLEQLSMEGEGKESSVKSLEKRISYALRKKPKVFFLQKNMDTTQAQAVGKQLGTVIVPVDLVSYDWKTEMQIIADAISSGK